MERQPILGPEQKLLHSSTEAIKESLAEIGFSDEVINSSLYFIFNEDPHAEITKEAERGCNGMRRFFVDTLDAPIGERYEPAEQTILTRVFGVSSKEPPVPLVQAIDTLTAKSIITKKDKQTYFMSFCSGTDKLLARLPIFLTNPRRSGRYTIKYT